MRDNQVKIHNTLFQSYLIIDMNSIVLGTPTYIININGHKTDSLIDLHPWNTLGPPLPTRKLFKIFDIVLEN